MPRVKPGYDDDYGAVFMLPLSGADDETPSLASSAPMRAFSASFSSRASRAISLTASNSSRLTMSRSRRIFSAWLRTTVSISRLTPWAAPAASFIRRPISSKNRLLVWVISISPVGCAVVGKSDNGDPERAVQGRSCARKSQSACHGPVSLQSYRTSAPSKKPRNRNIKKRPMIDQQIEIPTKDGHTTTFITHPERGGPHPVIILYMDAPGIREELRDMARRLGTSGYYVMLPNLYYRSGVVELGPLPADPESPERKRMFGFMNSINIPMVMEDTTALLAYADGQSAARKDIVGAVGYCMSGRYAINAATHFPGRIKAAASIYGTHLATDQPDSPHLAAGKTRAELYFGCAETDIYAPMEIIEKLKASMKGANAEVEIYPGTHHGFAFPKRPVYDRDAAERHWERLLALYRRNLVS